MSFPEEKDIQRIINMAGMDEGFFSIAVYSFIEKYMKNFILLNDSYAISERETKFKEILILFWAKKFHRELIDRFNKYGASYKWPKYEDANFRTLLNFCTGKGDADKVRHNFDYQGLDQIETSIYNLIKFCKIAGETKAEEKFNELTQYLQSWNKRDNSEELKKKVDELNQRILQFIENNGNKVKTIEELKAAQEEYENRINELEKLVSDNSETSEELKRIKHENDLLLEYVENLRQLTAYTKTRMDYETSITRLSLDQLKAVEQYNDEDFYLITGTAGTGKSLILIKIIEKILAKAASSNSPVPTYALLTYTNSLVKYSKYTADLIDKTISANIQTADSIISDTFSTCFPKKHFVADRNKTDFECTKEFLNKYFSKVNVYTRLDAAKELSNSIWPNFITKEDFFSDDYQLTCKSSKQDIWQIAEACNEIGSADDLPYSFAVYILAKELEQNPIKTFDYIFIDEVQDLSTAKLVCLKNMTSHMILTGDKNQRIYNHGKSWENLKLNFESNKYVLSTNFRNTIQINNFAEKYRTLNTDAISDASKEKPVGFRNGPEVEVYQFETIAKNFLPEHYEAIKAKVDLYIEELNYSPDNICILTSRYTEAVAKDLSQIGLETEIIKDMGDFTPSGKVKISSIYSAKGLSFPVVLFLTGETDVTGKKDSDYEKLHRNLYYIAMTRAMDILNIFSLSSNNDSQHISDIMKVRDSRL